jgi:arylsulfatase A-like enzyme
VPPHGAKNVLYFVVDDLRTQLGYASANLTVTPALDALAATATTFTHCYVQQAVCAPSRNSFMSGRRPDSIQVWTFTNDFREAPGGRYWISMPQHFKLNGYTTLGGGKTSVLTDFALTFAHCSTDFWLGVGVVDVGES